MQVISKSFPPDMVWAVQYDNTLFVRESIHEVISAILLAVLLVSIVTYMFLGTARAAFIPFCAIPVSLIGVFIFMGMFGFSINLLILFGLVLAVGLVVDDAIVVLENTQRHIQEGKDAKTATEITVVATSLVLMAVFVPVSFMGGITGQMFRQFGLCLATSIGLSTLVALTLSPALCSIILKSNVEKADFEFIQKFDDWFFSVRDKYLEVVHYFVSKPKNTLNLLCFFFLFILFMFIIIPKGFLPDEDRGALFTQIQLPDGASLDRTDRVAQSIVKDISTIPGIRSVLEIAGFSGENMALIVSELDEWSERKSSKKSLNTIARQINSKYRHFPEASVATFAPPAISGMSMFGGIDTSASGLTAERLRMDVISNNLANANTTRTPEGGPYHRRYVVFQPREYDERGFASFLAHALHKNRKNRDRGNGVRAVRIEEDRRQGPLVYDPGHPDANAVTAINAAKAMANTALEIGR